MVHIAPSSTFRKAGLQWTPEGGNDRLPFPPHKVLCDLVRASDCGYEGTILCGSGLFSRKASACRARRASVMSCNSRSTLGSSFFPVVKVSIFLLQSIHPEQRRKLRVGLDGDQLAGRHVDTDRFKNDREHLVLVAPGRVRPLGPKSL